MNETHDGHEVDMGKVLSSAQRGQITADGLVPAIEQFQDESIYPWERQPGEPNDWYHFFFEFFLKAGVRRSILEAHRRYVRVHAEEEGEEPSESFASPRWYFHSHKWQWQYRAEAYDEHQRILEQQRWEDRQHELREREWETASKLMGVAQDVLSRYEEAELSASTQDSLPKRRNSGRVQSPRPKAPPLKPADVARFAETGSKLGRLASGMFTDQTATVSVTARIEDIRKRRWESATPTLQKVLSEGETESESDNEDIVDADFIEDEIGGPPVEEDHVETSD